jgi:hypothetical protein
MKKKSHKIRPRNPVVPLMRLHRKPGAFNDRKKEASRRACRIAVRRDEVGS